MADPPNQDPNRQATLTTAARYARMAPLYDLMEIMPERAYRAWRAELWPMVEGRRIVEAGVGTGKNIAHYPPDSQITAFDLTGAMLRQAATRATGQGASLSLLVADAQAAPFADAVFDAAVATFVFCSVPDPRLGLRELRRVVRPGGLLYLLEHVQAVNEWVGTVMDWASPLTASLTGVHINRRTVANVDKSGWELETVRDMGLGDIFKLIVARNPAV